MCTVLRLTEHNISPLSWLPPATTRQDASRRLTSLQKVNAPLLQNRRLSYALSLPFPHISLATPSFLSFIFCFLHRLLFLSSFSENGAKVYQETADLLWSSHQDLVTFCADPGYLRFICKRTCLASWLWQEANFSSPTCSIPLCPAPACNEAVTESSPSTKTTVLPQGEDSLWGACSRWKCQTISVFHFLVHIHSLSQSSSWRVYSPKFCWCFFVFVFFIFLFCCSHCIMKEWETGKNNEHSDSLVHKTGQMSRKRIPGETCEDLED